MAIRLAARVSVRSTNFAPWAYRASSSTSGRLAGAHRAAGGTAGHRSEKAGVAGREHRGTAACACWRFRGRGGLVKSPGDAAHFQHQDHSTNGVAGGTPARMDVLGPWSQGRCQPRGGQGAGMDRQDGFGLAARQWRRAAIGEAGAAGRKSVRLGGRQWRRQGAGQRSGEAGAGAHRRSLCPARSLCWRGIRSPRHSPIGSTPSTICRWTVWVATFCSLSEPVGTSAQRKALADAFRADDALRAITPDESHAVHRL